MNVLYFDFISGKKRQHRGRKWNNENLLFSARYWSATDNSFSFLKIRVFKEKALLKVNVDI
jgi:hypothetical protein